MAFYAYLLRCNDGSYYAGHTDDLELRFAQHQSGALYQQFNELTRFGGFPFFGNYDSGVAS